MSGHFVLYDERENQLITKYTGAILLEETGHPFFRLMPHLSDEQFVAYLLERGHLSFEFVRWNEWAKLGMESEEAREIVRVILRDEIPSRGPTHQDDRVYDLQLIGVPKEKILNHRPSWWTRWTIKRLYAALRYPQTHYDLRAIVFLRMAGEIMVGETYRYVWAELQQRFHLKPEQSRFYYPHFDHDRKRLPGQEGEGHTEVSSRFLEDAITTPETFHVAYETAEKAFRVVWQFHNQFLPRYQFLRARL